MAGIIMINASCPYCKELHRFPSSLLEKETVCSQCGKSFKILKQPALSGHSPLARMVLEKGLVSESQLTYALKVQEMGRALGRTHPLDNILYRLGFISLHTLHHLFAATVRFLDREFGEIALKMGLITPEILKKALAVQSEAFKRSRLLPVGDILLTHGLLTKEQVDLIMFGYQDRTGFHPLGELPIGHDDETVPSRKPHVMGMIAVEGHLVGQAQLEAILEEMESEDSRDQTALETILLERKLITPEVLNELMAATERVLDRKFMAIVLSKKLVTKDQMHHAMEIQERERANKRPRLVSEILLHEGALSVEQCHEILKVQGRMAQGPSPTPVESRKSSTHPDLYAQLERGVAFGKMVVANRLITEAQLMEALAELKDALNAGKKISIDEILMKKKMVEQDTIVRLRMIKAVTETGAADKLFSEKALSMQLVTPEEVKAAFRQQIQEFQATRQIRSISEILVLKHQMTAADVERVRGLVRGRGPGRPSGPVPPTPQHRPPETGETRPEVRDASVGLRGPVLRISDDGLSAMLLIPETLVGGVAYSQVQKLARDAGIVYGLVDEATFAMGMHEKGASPTTVQVARGRAPVPGRNAEIRYHFARDYLQAGQVSEDGAIDFKTRGDIPHVTAQSLLAEKIPAVPGTPGMTVRGESLALPESGDVPLFAGPGAVLSSDGLSVHAERDGMPDAGLDGTLSVYPEYHVEGDVGLRTGHIVFEGNIIITGTVRDGFHVKGAHVTARAVKGAEIEASAGLLVTEGIIDSRVRSGGSVQAGYVSNSKIEAFGDLVVKKEILDSKIQVSGQCINKTGEIISSEVAALKGFVVRHVGTDVSKACMLKAGVNQHVVAILGEMREEIQRGEKRVSAEKRALLEQERELVALQGKTANLVTRQEQLLRELQRTPASLGTGDTARQSLEKERKEIDAAVESCFLTDDRLSAQIDRLKDQVARLEEALSPLKARHDAVAAWAGDQERAAEIIASGTLMEGTILVGPRSRRVLATSLHRVRLRERELEDGRFKME